MRRGAWQIEEEEAISRLKTDELDRLVAAARIREIDREHVRFIVGRIVQPPERPGDWV
jgi:predicted GNAT family N-acyltransferase